MMSLHSNGKVTKTSYFGAFSIFFFPEYHKSLFSKKFLMEMYMTQFYSLVKQPSGEGCELLYLTAIV